MLSALSATNETILRTTSRDELFQLVCDAAMTGAKFTSATILLADEDQRLLRVVASSGPGADVARRACLSVMADRPEGRGVVGTTHCDGCIASHVEAAIGLGVTREEIAEALGVSIAMNAGAAMVYSARTLDCFEEMTVRGVAIAK